jgi:membrane protein
VSIRTHPVVKTTIAWVRDIVERLVAVRIVESSIVLAAQAFLALFPLVIVVASVIPSGASSGLLTTLRAKFGLAGASENAFDKLMAQSGAIGQSLSVVSFLLVIGSATAFTRALQRIHQNAWGLPKLGLRGLWRGFAWLGGLILYLSVLGVLAHYIRQGAVQQPLSTVLSFMLWWWTPFLLLGGRVKARVLLPAAILITAAQRVVAEVSTVVMPHTLRTNEAHYGPLGVVFAFESWLVVVAGVLVTGTTLGAVIGRAPGRFGTWLRGTSDPDGWRRPVKFVHVTTPKFVSRLNPTHGEPVPADHAANEDAEHPAHDGSGERVPANETPSPIMPARRPDDREADGHGDGAEAGRH